MLKQELMQEINTKERELLNLNSELEEIEEKEKIEILNSKGFKKVVWLLNQEFESSIIRTPQYLEAHRIFKREFSKILKPLCDKIEISKPNHFDITGFFQMKDKRIYYFSIGDLRWDKTFLLRTAKDFKDYTGGSNNLFNFDDGFLERFYNYLERNKDFDKED